MEEDVAAFDEGRPALRKRPGVRSASGVSSKMVPLRDSMESDPQQASQAERMSSEDGSEYGPADPEHYIFRVKRVRNSRDGERLKKLKQIMGLAHPEEVEEAIAERPAVPSRPTTIAPEQAWVGLLLNGTVDLLFSPWFIFTSLVLDPRRACQVAAFSLFVDGLVSALAWLILSRSPTRARAWVLITLANLATVNTVYQMRVSAFPVPDSVVMPQTLYMGVLQILSLFNHNDSVLTLVNLLISFAASIVVEGVDVVHKGAFPDVAAAVIGGNHTLQYCSMLLVFVSVAILPSVMESNWFMLLAFLGTIYRELMFMTQRATPQYPLNAGFNVVLALLNFGMGYLLHKNKQQQELIVGDLYPKDVALALGRSSVHSYVSKLLRTGRDDVIEFRSHARRLPHQKFAPACTIMFMDVVEFTSLSGSVDPQSITYMLHELFCTLDRMCLKMRIYKLDTVGDCYIALDGLDGQPGHATRVVDYAIRAVAEAVTMMQPDGVPLAVRVGVHTGAVMSGVVGLVRKKFTLLGDSVNVASRMESTSEANTIQISEDTYRELSPAYQSIFARRRHVVEVKGKGVMTCYRFSPLLDDMPESLGGTDFTMSIDQSRASLSASPGSTRKNSRSKQGQGEGRALSSVDELVARPGTGGAGMGPAGEREGIAAKLAN